MVEHYLNSPVFYMSKKMVTESKALAFLLRNTTSLTSNFTLKASLERTNGSYNL